MVKISFSAKHLSMLTLGAVILLSIIFGILPTSKALGKTCASESLKLSMAKAIILAEQGKSISDEVSSSSRSCFYLSCLY